MRIERLELIGFKSFADKTVFTFHPGITGIVGPNGCGKSNIVDAFRWVLGEQSAKSLRGEKMEEVIFNGSSSKKPKGMAEVTMVISGMNGAGQGGNGQGGEDFATVTRRLFRSGESEYMINKSPCRLKDIRDVFLDTGLDLRSYSILEQGRIGEILNSKPLERRFIIEEVAGVMKYKVRKAEALSKLESSRANLVRINDIIAEVKKQITILDRLAKKAERYKKLTAEMHAIELKIARKEYHDIRGSFSAIIDELSGLKEKEALIGGEISDTENKTESRRIVVLEKEKALELVQRHYQEMEREIAEIERTVAVGRNDIGNLGEYHTKLLARKEEMDVRGKEILSRCEELKGTAEVMAREMEVHSEALREKTETFREVEEALFEKEDRIEDQRREIFKASEILSNLRNELGKQQTSLESLERREAGAEKEAGDSRKILSDIEAAIGGIESEILGNNNEILLLEEKKEMLRQELLSGRSSLDERIRSLAAAREDLASCLSRLESLREIVFDRPARELVSSCEGVKLLATLSEVMDVDAEYEKAVEAALSEKADLFIMEGREEIERVLSLPDAERAGKMSFITIAPPPGGPDAGGTNFSGMSRRALDFVRPREGYLGIVENLLRNVMVVRDLETAFTLRTQSELFTFVTLAGEMLEPSGAVVAGEGKGIFRRKREIRELEELAETKRAFIEDMNRKIQSLQSAIAEREEGERVIESSLRDLEKAISLSRLTVDNYREDRERTSRKLAYLKLEIEEISKEKVSLGTVISGTEEKIRAAEERKAETEEQTAVLQEAISRKKAEIEEYRSEVTDLKLLITSGREKIEAVRNEIESSLRTHEDLTRRRNELDSEGDAVLAKISERQNEIKELEEKLRKLVAEAGAVRAEISGKKDEIEHENEDLLVVEHGLKTLRQELAAVTSRVSELEVLRAEHKMRMENLAANVMTNYGMELETVEMTEVTAEDEQRLGELRGKVQEIGPVNLGTLDEYEDLRTRYEFLTKQHEDLTKSIAELEEAISKINSTTRKKLRDAFESLNEKFGEVFVTLFGGGRAELILTDEQNILESGLEIVAQPPGKKLQNLHLLSGGEKALTALSVQFASFLIKPTPLCILDEADAPLDESNTERYARMLDELSRETQFVVVTHNRTTMSIAQHMYGITMEEAGVSKVISMQLTAA